LGHNPPGADSGITIPQFGQRSLSAGVSMEMIEDTAPPHVDRALSDGEKENPEQRIAVPNLLMLFEPSLGLMSSPPRHVFPPQQAHIKIPKQFDRLIAKNHPMGNPPACFGENFTF
jgi:hypothetical protein